MVETTIDASQEVVFRSTAVELMPFVDGSGEGRFRAKAADGRQFLLPAFIADLLRLLDGRSGGAEVAERLARQYSLAITAEEVNRLINDKLAAYGLVAKSDAADPVSPPSAPQKITIKASVTQMDFSLRIPFLSHQRVEPITERLVWLFHLLPIAIGLGLTIWAHFAFYGEPRGIRAFARTPSDLCLAYVVAIATMLFHELGHATASTRFGCSPGDIGFTLYLMFPGFYADMSRAWKLTGKQRAVIDIGGVYFQLLSVIPLYLLHRLTGRTYFATGIYALDFMCLFSLNPIMKFDGYWLLVDLCGLPNLQRRAFTFLGECLTFLRHGTAPKTLSTVAGRWRKMLVGLYAFVMGAGITVSLPFLIRSLPQRIRQLGFLIARVRLSLQHSPEEALLAIGKLAGSLFFFIFLFKMLRMVVTLPAQGKAGTPAAPPQEAARTPATPRQAAAAAPEKESPVREYFHIALQSALMLFIAGQAIVLLHELAHGMTALALGGHFPFFQVTPASGRAIFLFSYGSPGWQDSVVLLAGYTAQILVACTLIPITFSKRPLSAARFWGLFAGIDAAVSVLIGSGVAPPWQSRGEIGQALAGLGLPSVMQPLWKTGLAAGALVLAAVFLGRVASAIDVSGSERYLSRLRATSAVWGLPFIVLMAGYSMVTGAWRHGIGSGAPPILFALCAVLLTPLWWRPQTPVPGGSPTYVRHTGWLALAAAAIVIGQVTVFGLDQQHPRGVFLTRHAPEVTVASCNVFIRIDRESAHVRMLMRPFVSEHEFLWEPVRNQAPDRWTYYDKFASDNLPRLLEMSRVQQIRRYWSAEMPFYAAGRWTRGARVVEFDVRLPGLADGPFMDVTVNDFWKQQKAGYLDFVQVELGEGLSFGDLASLPPGARPPAILNDRVARWLNREYNGAFASARLEIVGGLQ